MFHTASMGLGGAGGMVHCISGSGGCRWDGPQHQGLGGAGGMVHSISECGCSAGGMEWSTQHQCQWVWE